MPKLALLIEYDGTDFAGWQTQGLDEGARGRSVQAEIERSFLQLFSQPITVHGAGRTDAGVHARGMVAHVDFPDAISITNSKLLIALNATTPEDVVVRDLRAVDDDFHARFSASARQYCYRVKCERTALDRRYMWALRRPVDREKLVRSAAKLIGEYDFTSFSKRTADVKHYRCIVSEARWDFHGTVLALTIRANRFVRGMVRALVGAMVQVGQGVLSEDEFEGLLRSPQEVRRAKYIAPPHGLVLEGVEYPERFGLWPITNSEISY